MTYEAQVAAFEAEVELAFEASRLSAALPAHEDVADPETGWATCNPGKAIAFLFVSPRECAAFDELMAL